MNGITIYQGDALEVLKTLPDESVNCVLTSPPYWRQRDYKIAGQIGLEETPEEYTDSFGRSVSRVPPSSRDRWNLLAQHRGEVGFGRKWRRRFVYG